ncbi:uncharacterized protein TNCV_2801901 [Trichonephila clavipes]|nr:uncharacterized protein TNCV_2801901 [Trichonephila clavipes]
MDTVIGCSSARAVSRHLGVPYSTVWNVLRKVVHFFPYKIRHNQQLMANDREKRLTFALTFLARVEVDASWPWKILWSNEAHFHVSGTVNTHNCRIWDTENPRTFQEIPLHSPKVSLVWIHSHIHSWTFLFRRDYSQWPCDLHRDGQEVQKHA